MVKKKINTFISILKNDKFREDISLLVHSRNSLVASYGTRILNENATPENQTFSAHSFE